MKRGLGNGNFIAKFKEFVNLESMVIPLGKESSHTKPELSTPNTDIQIDKKYLQHKIFTTQIWKLTRAYLMKTKYIQSN